VIAARTPDAVPGVIASAPPIGRNDAAVIAADAAAVRMNFRMAYSPLEKDGRLQEAGHWLVPKLQRSWFVPLLRSSLAPGFGERG